MNTDTELSRNARAKYMRHYRDANPDKALHARRVADARRRALQRLVELHPADMQRLYDAERQAAGL